MQFRSIPLWFFIASAVLPAFAQDTPNRQVLKRSADGERPGMNYWIYIPRRTGSREEPLPLLLFLHGGGEGGGDPELVKKHGPPKLIGQGKDYLALVVSPQNPSKTQYWDDQQLIQLVDQICAEYSVDPERIYLTGMSRGCYGGWRLLIQNPKRFAAFVGVCGGGPAPYVKRVAAVPIRLYHGALDNVIPIEESTRMLDAHNNAGGDCELTIYPDANHDAWSQTYRDAAMETWLFAQRRRSNSLSRGVTVTSSPMRRRGTPRQD